MSSERIRYVRSADGVQIAWTEVGSGPTLVYAANHITDFARDGPHTTRYDQIVRLSAHFRVVRYDHRGTGSSQRDVARQGLEAWVDDLEAVVRAAAPVERVILFGTSQASPYSAVFAARNPERLTHLVLYGAYPAGLRATGDPDSLRRSEAFLDLIRLDWDGPNPVARAMVQTTVFPEPRPQELAWQDHLPLMVTREDAVRFFVGHDEQDARPYLEKIRTPTLVMATSEDKIVAPVKSRMVAAAIPGSVYVELPGYNHIPLPHDPSWEPLFDHLLAFLSTPATPANLLARLSGRERDILDGVCAGLSNEAIPLQRNISVKTVRNHLTSIFDKLRVRSRTQAALLASRSSARHADSRSLSDAAPR